MRLLPKASAALLGTALAVAAVTGTANAATTTHATPQEIVQYYQTYSQCNAAGAKGVRQNQWDYYECYQVFDADDYWALDVQYYV